MSTADTQQGATSLGTKIKRIFTEETRPEEDQGEDMDISTKATKKKKL
jgi:hypothetical protein